MGFWDYFKAIAVIIGVIAAAFCLTRLLARAGGANARRSGAIRLLGFLPLARDRSVAVVEIGGFAYILGIGAQRVERLDKLAAADLDLKNGVAAPGDFSSCFHAELKARLKRPVDK